MNGPALTMCAVMAGVLLQAGVAAAQEWTAEQRVLIDRVTACNDAWVASLARKDFAVFTTACPLDPDGLYWYASGAPTRYGATEDPWRGSVDRGGRTAWRSLEPVAVQIHGDVALLYYTVVWTPEADDGQKIDVPSRRLTVFRRVDGEWVQIGGTIAPPRP